MAVWAARGMSTVQFLRNRNITLNLTSYSVLVALVLHQFSLPCDYFIKLEKTLQALVLETVSPYQWKSHHLEIWVIRRNLPGFH